MSNVLDAFKAYISPELLSEAAILYGENEAGIAKALGSIAPAILGGLLEKSGDSHSIDQIFNTVSNFDPAILERLGSLLGAESISKDDPRRISDTLLQTIFGAKIPAITNAVAAFSGVKTTTVTALLALAGPMVLGFLSQKIKTDGLNASGLVRYLLSQKANFSSVLPASVSAMLGLTRGGDGGVQSQPLASIKWLWPFLLVLVIGAILALYLRSGKA